MKKKVLFIIGTLQSGGVSKSMISLLKTWDVDKYETDLLLCCKDGDIFSKYLSQNIHIIYNPIIEHVMGGFTSIKWLFVHGHFILAFGVCVRLILSKISKSLAGELIAKMMPALNKCYDLIVDYGGQQQLYYMVDKLHSKRKISFFHSDYAKWSYYYKADKKYYPKVDFIFSISQGCIDSLKQYFPNCTDKIAIMGNISSPKIIREQANLLPTNLKDFVGQIKTKGDIILCTIGHVCYGKGSDIAIEAAEYLKNNNIRFKWFFVGKVLDEKFINFIKDKNLTDYIHFVGIQSNPYPYIELSDIIVHPSRFEGKSIALDEAKILCKPIVVTNFSTVHDQFENKINASICEMNGKAVGKAIIELINNKVLRQSYINNLSSNIIDNSTEVEKLYRFL